MYFLLKFFKSNKLIIHERGTSWNTSSKLSHRLSFISNKVEKIVVNSNATKYLLVNKFNLEKYEAKINVIHNGIIIKNKFENLKKI